MMLLAASSDNSVGLVVLCVIAAFTISILGTSLRERIAPRNIGPKLWRFFGRRAAGVRAYDKSFPGYDLVSINRAVESLIRDLCLSSTQLGGNFYPGSLGEALAPTGNGFKLRLGEPRMVRVPIDVDEEDSFLANCIWTATLRPETIHAATRAKPASEAEIDIDPKIAIFLTCADAPGRSDDYFDDSSESAIGRTLTISIACRSKEIAHRLFNELDRRRREQSIYRGKVITPLINAAGVQSIGFSRIRTVAENELILPDRTKKLIKSSIVGFYRHVDTLRATGVELKRGVLFVSKPGTGKTTIALYLAGLLPEFTVCFVSGRQLLYPREICRMARYLRPAMLVFEDIDLVAQDRDSNGLVTVLGELMNQIDGCLPDEEVLFIMNTNSLDRLEQAVRDRPGRVDQIIEVPLPDESCRRKLVQLFARHMDLTDEAINRLVSATDGATPATIKEVIKRAAVLAVQRTHIPNYDTVTTWQPRPAGTDTPDPTETTPRPRVHADDLLLAYEQVSRGRHE